MISDDPVCALKLEHHSLITTFLGQQYLQVTGIEIITRIRRGLQVNGFTLTQGYGLQVCVGLNPVSVTRSTSVWPRVILFHLQEPVSVVTL